MASGLQWSVTGLWYPDAASLADLTFVGQVRDPHEAEITIPLNDARRASVTVDLNPNDELIGQIYGNTYYYALKAYYNDHLVFWGPINLLEVDWAARTARINATDPSIRLSHHYLRRGDLDSGTTAPLTKKNGDKGWVTVDEVGLRLLRDAGNNTPDQDTRGVAVLGIADGSNDFGDPVGLMSFARGDEVWNSMLQLCASLGPDFELEPIEDTPGAYCQLNTYDKQGTDKTATVQLHYGTGKQNLESLAFTEGSKFITHVHVLDRQRRYRFTEANTSTSLFNGVYVEWDATDFDATNIAESDAEDVLRAYGQDVLKAYSSPLRVITLGLPVETGDVYRYIDDYGVGDIIRAAGRGGGVDLSQSAAYRITQVALKQAGRDNLVQPELEVITSDADPDDFTGSEE